MKFLIHVIVYPTSITKGDSQYTPYLFLDQWSPIAIQMCQFLHIKVNSLKKARVSSMICSCAYMLLEIKSVNEFYAELIYTQQK